jgi:hypothetical protein
MIGAAKCGRTGERYILGSDNIAMRDLLDAIDRIVGRRGIKITIPAPLAVAIGAISEAQREMISTALRQPLRPRRWARASCLLTRKETTMTYHHDPNRNSPYNPNPQRTELSSNAMWGSAPS